MTLGRLPSAVLRYGLAVLSVGLASVATKFLKGLGDSGISPQFFAAVFLSSWYGGFGPGLLATFLSGMATGYLLFHDNHSFAAYREDVLRVLIFTAVSVLTSSFHAATRRAKEAAELASAAKSRFLAMVSHELRTPLSPVLMIAQSLAEDMRLPADVRSEMEVIRRNVDLEVRLIEDLVDLTRINIGRMSLKMEVVDVHQPLEAAIQVCEKDIRDKKIELSVHRADETLNCCGDAVRLQQVFWNLIRNAVKFTPAGGRITIWTRGSADGNIVIEVKDTGIGIDAGRLSAIFEVFEQEEPDSHVRFGGLGLGLAICRALVEAHHGSIAAASPGRGGGTTITVKLPRFGGEPCKSDGSAPRAAKPTESTLAVSGLK